MTPAIPTLQPWQRRLIAVAWISYAAYYLGRVNLPPAMPALQTDLALTKSQLGLMSSGFFWAYAVGQLVNGQLGDRLSPRRFVLAGMLASAGLNFIFGAASLYIVMVVLWTLNGYCQATGWGPILRALSNWLTPAQTRRVSGLFASCFVSGNALALLLAGWLVARFGWRTAFLAPALLFALIALFWYAGARDTPQVAGFMPPAATEPEGAGPGSANLLISLVMALRRHWALVVAAIGMGFSHAALGVWLPTYFVEAIGLTIGPASTLSALLPVAGIGGTLITGWWVGRYLAGREARGLLYVQGALTMLFLFYPLLPRNIVLNTLGLMLIGSILFGATSLILTTMPLVISQRETASGTVGLISFAFNIGAGLSGGIIGAILDAGSWPVVFGALALASFAGGAFVWLTIKSARTPHDDK